jgi:hypothetical protein
MFGCTQINPKTEAYPPLIVADATPIMSASKRSIGVKIKFENIAHADYSYARFKLTAYDSAGNTIRPKKGKRDSAYVRLAGPIAQGRTRSTTWKNTWTSNGVKCISLDEVELIFPDGRVELAINDRLLSEKTGNRCL